MTARPVPQRPVPQRPVPHRPVPHRRVLLAPALAALLAGTAAPAQAQPSGAADWPPPAYPVAVLQGLDKVTARISTFEARVDAPVEFGGLEIVVRACHKTPPTEAPEAIAFLEIAEIERDRPRQQLYSGWMYASSPAVAALEHPVYDVWVKDCAEQLSQAPEGDAPAAGAEADAAPRQ